MNNRTFSSFELGLWKISCLENRNNFIQVTMTPVGLSRGNSVLLALLWRKIRSKCDVENALWWRTTPKTSLPQWSHPPQINFRKNPQLSYSLYCKEWSGHRKISPISFTEQQWSVKLPRITFIQMHAESRKTKHLPLLSSRLHGHCLRSTRADRESTLAARALHL